MKATYETRVGARDLYPVLKRKLSPRGLTR